MNFDEEKSVITDVIIENRLKRKMRVNSRMIIWIFISLLFVAFSVVMVVKMIRSGSPAPLGLFEGLYLIVLTPIVAVIVVFEFRKTLKEKKAQKRSHGAFTVTEDTITSVDEQIGEMYKGSRSYILTVGLAHHEDYVTHTSELVGANAETGEKCYVVAYTEEPKTPVLVYSAKIYRYVKQ